MRVTKSRSGCFRRRPRVPAHVLIETFSVLTRLPPPHRGPPGIVVEFLLRRFDDPPLELPGVSYLRLLERGMREGITGGAIYDALVAATAERAGATLITRDRRALKTYDAMGTRSEFVG